ncbi:Nitrogen assimilation transcription factor nit-4 [Pseudocyphellaria aurata]|nr:Nitrogen assimilation transcription factor nit-4 [Pseudocyphellaria aurata]
MAEATLDDHHSAPTATNDLNSSAESLSKQTPKSRQRDKASSAAAAKRRCVSTACIACRRRKSKCDGNLPSCAACSSVYGTECIYDPNSDHRRKGVYKKDIDNLKTRNSTLQTLIQAILNFPEQEVPSLIQQIRTCESLDDVAESILSKNNALVDDEEECGSPANENDVFSGIPQSEMELSGKMGELRLENGSVSFIGGTSNLLFLGSSSEGEDTATSTEEVKRYPRQEDAIVSWTTVTTDSKVVIHLINMYFTWHYPYFATLSKSLFYRDFLSGKPFQDSRQKPEYCTSLLVNAMLALGCHFTSLPASRMEPSNSATAGDHFFKEAKQLILKNDEHEHPRLPTVQALALMSVREAGCGREAKGWVYSGMSFRMAYDLGLNVDSAASPRDDQETDARRMTIWGCFLFDKCWSNYLGRQPQLPLSSIAVPKFDVFPMEDADGWSPYVDAGLGQVHSQPSRTRAIALQISLLCEISSDLLLYFYNPAHLEKPKGRQAELKKLSDLHTRLEAWRKNLPKEMEPKEGQLPNVLVMHMFFQLLFIHLFRPFLKYKQAHSPLPAHVSPRKFCTHAAATISKLLRLYKRTYGLRQICNIAVYIAHSACTIHLLNLPEKNAIRDIVHGVKHLEEIAESWLCARRTLSILETVARRWKVTLPEEATKILLRTKAKYGLHKYDHGSPRSNASLIAAEEQNPVVPSANDHNSAFSVTKGYLGNHATHASESAAPERACSGEAMSLFPGSAADLGEMSRPKSLGWPQTQQEPWSQVSSSRGVTAQAETSPSILFGGIESLIEESQDWWLKDQATFFDNWYGPDQEVAFLAPETFNDYTGSGMSASPYEVNEGDTIM